ncbi:HD-GYP domain-containing protein [Paenibacillus lutrae]|uniref:HD domain-containing protein n=1 Tax=Paenibacillus lutrae TaxID=2078573 RepID=A0A7X3FLY9_9BACL|nr:HD-GYP domain-containing protein [Paenibacillus lutrae]MVP02067.1 HD domain-containing protein [Paenibacillus lutrae]
MRIRSLSGPAAIILLPYLLFIFLKSQPGLDAVFVMPRGHFYIVSSVALLAFVIALAVGAAGRRMRNTKVIFLALSFISLAGIFMVHGLSTPDLLLHATHVPGVTATLSVIMATFWLWLSSYPSDNRFIVFLSQHDNILLPVWTLALALFGVTVLSFPELLDSVQTGMDSLNWLLIAVTALFNFVTIYRYYHSYLYSRFPLQIAIVYSAGCLVVSQLIMIQGQAWKSSWWMYHFLLLASMIIMLAGLYKQYAANQSLSGALRALFTTDPIERITNSLSPSVRALMNATENKDVYTAGHNFRVTFYALKLAEEMQLGPDKLRALAHGTIVHDVGKIDIPDAILNKPGKLTDSEREIINQHTVSGYEICRSLGFMEEELGIIRSHHEKWNGEGYPDRLKADQIPLMARIVSVTDVYDALTSNRAYRKALSHEAAMIYLRDNKGIFFDPVCVEAWERACDKDSSIYL